GRGAGAAPVPARRAGARRERVLGVGLVVSLALFALLAASYRGEVGEADREVAGWVARELPSPVEWAARPFSWLGGWIGLTALGVAAGLSLLRARAWLDVGFLLASFLGSQLTVAALKAGFDRARPDVGSAVPLPDSPAFPSGHATAGAASLGALAVLLSERLPSPRARVRLWAATVVLGVGVGLSRVALNVHYVSDVLAGWCFGLAWLAACLLLRERLRRRPRRAPRGRQATL
ncbi:MAG TPA: phosphatase PAP2 family protein, partial [Gaiellaceae bacterium]|nr:phosphatase PAP2 family protein [Gaiellaceae bacterium]